MFWCQPCNRNFCSRSALWQHLETSSAPHPTCNRCDRVFSSRSAKQQHLEDSDEHRVAKCQNRNSIQNHNSAQTHSYTQNYTVKHNYYCYLCKYWFSRQDQLALHETSEHYKCETCQDYFDSRSDLIYHLRTHNERSVKCPGCPRLFISDAAMVLHLETGACESGVDREEVQQLAFDCWDLDGYICDDDDDPNYDFVCATCDVPYRFISGMLQHAESEACEETLAKNSPLGKFLKLLRKRVG